VALDVWLGGAAGCARVAGPAGTVGPLARLASGVLKVVALVDVGSATVQPVKREMTEQICVAA
jgi:hypothetical protein